MRSYLTVALLIILLGAPYVVSNYTDQVAQVADFFARAGSQLAAAIMHNPRTVADLRSRYNAAKSASSTPNIRILIVPGHEPDYGGAEFRDSNYGMIYERDLNVELAADLNRFLRQNPKYDVFVTRDTVNWYPIFSSYFQADWNAIVDWQKSYREEMTRLITVGLAKKEGPAVYHNTVPRDVALRLYGITKWANESKIDITIHVHFNDYPGHPRGVPGDHSGFTIYVPSDQYENSTTTRAVALTVFKRLAKYNPVSDLPGESSGIVNEPDLIAVGANNTADSASMLIEYGYLYESQFVNPETRALAVSDLAYQTYLGLQDFFDKNNSINLANSYDTLVLPHYWKTPLTASASKPAPQGPDVYALQTVLQIDGEYPPADKTLNDCPRSGRLGACTRAALGDFQKKYGIEGERGIAGAKTLEILNQRWAY